MIRNIFGARNEVVEGGVYFRHVQKETSVALAFFFLGNCHFFVVVALASGL